MKVIDSHAHFWDIQLLHYPWIEEGSYFKRNFLPEDYLRASRDVPIEKIVFVECNCNSDEGLKEMQWVQAQIENYPAIRGMVGHVPLTETNLVDARLQAMSAMPLVKGIRHNIQHNEPGFATQKSFVEGVRKVHALDFHFELCLFHHQLAETIELIAQCPGVRFVLDHCAKPGIKAGLREPWMKQMEQVAQFENVVCKISGLVTEADWAAWKTEEILFYAQHAVSVFEKSRIMFGSDWPISEVAGGYLVWYQLTRELTRTWSKQEQEDFYYNNAERFYRLGRGEG